jgi:16S rRNA (guanine527-N7)-methyltransferase
MEDRNRELLLDGIQTLGLQVPAERMARLIGYHDLLMATNEQFNLTGFRDERESVIYNLLNSLAPWRHVDASRRAADVGAGGGMPGLPLAIALDMPVTLIESKRKKADFLKQASGQFAPLARVLHIDVNEVGERFTQVLSSAFGSLEKLLAGTERMREQGCRTLAWKGRREVIDQEVAACKPRDRNWQVIPFTVPHMPEAQRHLCIHVTRAGGRTKAASRARAR